MGTIFKVFIEFVTLLLLFYGFWLLGQEACRILVPWPGTEPTLPALKGEVLDHWTASEVHRLNFFLEKFSVQFSSVQSLSRVRLFATPWIAACQASLSITNSRSLPRLMCIESVMPSSHLILCCPLLHLPPIPPSIRVFSNESALCRRWPKYCSFSFRIVPSKEHPGLISLRMDWLDLLAVQGTLKSLLQHHSSKALILWRLAFFTVQLSHTWPLKKP